MNALIRPEAFASSCLGSGVVRLRIPRTRVTDHYGWPRGARPFVPVGRFLKGGTGGANPRPRFQAEKKIKDSVRVSGDGTPRDSSARLSGQEANRPAINGPATNRRRDSPSRLPGRDISIASEKHRRVARRDIYGIRGRAGRSCSLLICAPAVRFSGTSRSFT